MRRISHHILLLLLTLTLIFGLSITAGAAWTDDSLPAEDMKTLINSQALYPQPSGYEELDSLIAQILEPYESSDTYTKLYQLYDWTVRNITYSWEGYSQQWAPCYDKFTLNYIDTLTYKEGLQEAIPQEIVNRSYHAIAENKGICYDWGALMAIMARYVGLEAYVHTGYFVFEATGGWGHHGWCEIVLDGKNYIFDPQRDYRWTLDGTDKERALYYFGIPVNGTNNHRYTILLDTAANAARDAQFLPVTAKRSYSPLVSVSKQGSGTISGTGRFSPGSTVTLKAVPDANNVFVGWYDKDGVLLSGSREYTFSLGDSDVSFTGKFAATVQISAVSSRSGSVSGAGSYTTGNTVTLTASGSLKGWYDGSGTLLSTNNPYTFTASAATTVYALFAGDHFIDIPEEAWYEAQVTAAIEKGITKGVDALHFDPDGTFTRAMVVEMLARIEGADTASAEACSYSDVDQHQWYADAVNWASENGIVKGVGENKFAPEQKITRQELVTILGRYLEEYKGIPLSTTDVGFQDADKIADFAQKWIGKAVAIGLIVGYPDNTFGPTDASTRAVGAAIMVRLDNYLNAA